MLKIKELFKSLIDTQKSINENLIKISKELEKTVDTITVDSNKLSTCMCTIDRLDSMIETNVYTKKQTVEAINKEIDYKNEYEKCLKKNEPLLRLVEKYCKYKDKYEVINYFYAIDLSYDIKMKSKKVEV